MSDPFESTKPEEIAPFVGKHFIYTYENGWQYEMYIKNDRTMDYRVHGGLVGGRWVRDQEAHIIRIAKDVFKVSWSEPTGTTVSVAINLAERRSHGATLLPAMDRAGPAEDRLLPKRTSRPDAAISGRGSNLPDCADRRVRHYHVPGGLRP